LLGSGDVGVAPIEWKYLFAFLVAASPFRMVPFADPHLLHVPHPWSLFDPCSTSIAVERVRVVNASLHLWFRLAGSVRRQPTAARQVDRDQLRVLGE